MLMIGGCVCGAVRYEVAGPPLFACYCYCEGCRKTSSTHSASFAVLESALSLTGELATYSRPPANGPPVTRSFCPKCGTGILSRGERRPGILMLRAGTLDDAEQFQPMVAIFASRAPSWDQPPDGLPAFPEMPPSS